MAVIKIAPDIYWVGVIDWDVRHFHGHTYTTNRGTTYNAYLVIDEKVALIDNVLAPFSEDFFANIQQIIPLDKIDYIIANHVETDHSGSLPQILRYAENAKVFGTQRCQDGLMKHYNLADMNFRVVKTNDTLKLGRRSLVFMEAPMVHWPDSMFTYCPQEKILFPNDAFGQHYATSERFDDEVDYAILMEEAKKYYANILWPLNAVIKRKLDEVKRCGWPIKMIAPSHGVIWRSYPQRILAAYTDWAENKTIQEAVIVYETMWSSTAKMARCIAEGMIEEGVKVKLFDVNASDRTQILTEMLQAKGFLIGSSTHDNGMLPNLASFMQMLRGIRPQARCVGIFGSYGWQGGAIKEIEDILKEMFLPLAIPSLGVRYVPGKEELKSCIEFGRSFAKLIKQDI